MAKDNDTKTLLEAIDARRLHPSDYKATIRVLELLRLADHRIIDGVGLVAMGVEAGAKMCWGLAIRHQTGELPSRLTMMHWELVDEKVKERWREEARAILTACGVIVPDEVVTLTQEEADEFPEYHAMGSVAHCVYQYPGDTIIIKRKSSESPNGCTRKSILHLQDKEKI